MLQLRILIPLSSYTALAQAESGVLTESGGGILQMILALLLVLGLLVASLWLLKRLAAPRGPGSALLKIVAGTSVGPRERVVLLEIGGSTWLVLGVAPGRVSALAEIPRQELAAPAENQDTQGFPAWLKHVTERRNAAR